MGVEKEIENKLRGELGRVLSDHCQDIEDKLTAFRAKHKQIFEELLDTVRAASQNINSVDVIAERTVADLVSDLRRERVNAFANLNFSIFKIRQQQTQSDILTALLEGAAFFSPRVAIFITRGDNFVGWHAHGFSGGFRDDLIKTVLLPKTVDTILKAALETRRTFSGDAFSHAENAQLLEKFGAPEPRKMVVIPMVINRKTPAVLYADCGHGDGSLINTEALEVLSQVTCLTIENLALGLIQEKVPMGVKDALKEPAVSPRGPSAFDSPVLEKPVEPRVERSPVIEEHHEEEQLPIEAATPTPAFEQRVEAEIRHEEPISFTPPVIESSSPEVTMEPSAEPATAVAIEEIPTPAASAVRPSVAKPSNNESWRGEPIPPEDAKLYSEAKRCARLVVTEIRMYNEQKVVEGRRNGDLYARLKQEIDRGREWYEKRVPVKVRAKVDYFHDYLVEILGEKNGAILGKDYPGPKIESNN
jgi:hypothetical protein